MAARGIISPRMTDATDPLDLNGQQQLADERARQADNAERQESEDMKWLMSGKRGRRVMWRLLERAGIYRSSFTGNSETFFREGQRNLGLVYLDQIHAHSPAAYSAMIEENRAKQ